MMVVINDELLYKLVDHASDMGRLRERIAHGDEPEFISQNQAHKRFGKGSVERWVKGGLVRRYKDADGKLRSGVRYSLPELMAAAFKCNCISGLSQVSKDEIADTHMTDCF